MDSILINGQETPVLKIEDGLPLVNRKGLRCVCASTEEDVKNLMFDGTIFLCPIDFTRTANAEENIRKTPLTPEEEDQYISMIEELGDVGLLTVTEDDTGEALLKHLDGNNRRRLFKKHFKAATHVAVLYKEVTSRLEAMKVQSIANTHTKTTHESEAFKALEAKTITDSLPKDDRDAELSFFYAEIAKDKKRGKVEFTKRWKRAKYAIDTLWEAFADGKITIESLDAIATLINPDTAEILADLQQSVLDSAIAQNLKTSQVTAKVTAALANWQAEWEASQQVRVPEPVEDVEEELFAIAPAKGAGRPVSAAPKATKPPANPKPAPVEKITAAAVVQQKQEVKATKGKGGRKSSAPSAAKVMTNAPASIPAAIAANPNIHIAVIGREPEKKVIAPVEIYQPLLDIEDLLVEKKLVLSNGSGLTEEAWKGLESLDLKGIDDVLAQVQVLRVFLSKIEESALAVQIDLKDK